jgi:hypothetical protein
LGNILVNIMEIHLEKYFLPFLFNESPVMIHVNKWFS